MPGSDSAIDCITDVRGRHPVKRLCTQNSITTRIIMRISTIAKLFEDQLKDIHSAGAQLVKALPKMAKKASSSELQQAISSHLRKHAITSND